MSSLSCHVYNTCAVTFVACTVWSVIHRCLYCDLGQSFFLPRFLLDQMVATRDGETLTGLWNLRFGLREKHVDLNLVRVSVHIRASHPLIFPSLSAVCFIEVLDLSNKFVHLLWHRPQQRVPVQTNWNEFCKNDNSTIGTRKAQCIYNIPMDWLMKANEQHRTRGGGSFLRSGTLLTTRRARQVICVSDGCDFWWEKKGTRMRTNGERTNFYLLDDTFFLFSFFMEWDAWNRNVHTLLLNDTYNLK